METKVITVGKDGSAPVLSNVHLAFPHQGLNIKAKKDQRQILTLLFLIEIVVTLAQASFGKLYSNTSNNDVAIEILMLMQKIKASFVL